MLPQTAIFASGCFWCTEAIFQDLRGVSHVISGYIGGTTKNPTYEEVSGGGTGYAEALQVSYDPAVITYDQLVEVFFLTHDPTTMNRQGNDVGTQYRSAIFYLDAEQQKTAAAVKVKIEAEKVYPRPIVSTIEPATKFYPAETYHQNYYAQNPEQGYCQLVISPKVAKFRKKFAAWLK